MCWILSPLSAISLHCFSLQTCPCKITSTGVRRPIAEEAYKGASGSKILSPSKASQINSPGLIQHPCFLAWLHQRGRGRGGEDLSVNEFNSSPRLLPICGMQLVFAFTFPLQSASDLNKPQFMLETGEMFIMPLTCFGGVGVQMGVGCYNEKATQQPASCAWV